LTLSSMLFNIEFDVTVFDVTVFDVICLYLKLKSNGSSTVFALLLSMTSVNGKKGEDSGLEFTKLS